MKTYRYHQYFFSLPVQVESIEWAYENIGEITSKGQLNNMADFLAHKQLDLVINLPMRHGGARRVSSFSTHGKIFHSDFIDEFDNEERCSIPSIISHYRFSSFDGIVVADYIIFVIFSDTFIYSNK